MDRRRSTAALIALVALAAVLSSCLGPPEPPTVYTTEPAVVSSSVSPQVVVAGQPVTFTLHATHSVGFAGLLGGIADPTATGAPAAWGCGNADWQRTGTPTDATYSVTCTIPAIAPSGSWYLTANAQGIGAPWADASIRFEVVGGSDDLSGPTEVSRNITPNPVPRGSDVTFTIRVSEPHSPTIELSPTVMWPFGNQPVLPCEPTTLTPMGGDLYETTTVCHTVATTWIGEYYGIVRLIDSLGHSSGFELKVNVVA